jgi:putative alpha-1,2-mannosidase
MFCTGHVFAGATIPYGMAKAVADTDSDDNQGGFVSGDSSLNITGFSSMHDSVCVTEHFV